MSVTKTLLIKEFNPTKLVHGKTSEKMVTFYYPVNSSDKEFSKLRIQTPKMHIPFNLEDRKSGDKIFLKNVNLSLRDVGSDSNKRKILMFEEKLNELDKKIVELLPESLKNKHFYPSLYQGKNANYKPNMKISIPYDGDDCKISVFDEQNNLIPGDRIQKNVVVSAIIRLDKLWIWNDKIGLNWVAEQIKIYNVNKKISKYYKLRDDDDDDDE